MAIIIEDYNKPSLFALLLLYKIVMITSTTITTTAMVTVAAAVGTTMINILDPEPPAGGL